DQGAARGVDVFVCVNVGTGIGMGIVVDGQLFRGAHGAAGEVGYLPYGWTDGDSEGWTPATQGMLERSAAATSVVRLARERGVDAVLTGAIATGLRAAQDIVFERRGENAVTQRSDVNV